MMLIINTLLKVVALLLISVTSFAQKHNVLTLVSPHFPPYTYKSNNKVVGLGPDLIRQVLDNTNIQYNIVMVDDYGEAVHVIKAKLADGMFLASQNTERDAIAVFTQPLLINKWSWFMLKESDLDPKSETFKLQADIGTIKGTNTYLWLKSNGYAVAASPPEASSLVAMLTSGRIDAVFLSDVVFENELDEKTLFKLKKSVEMEKDFSMYISHDYLKRHPESIDKINLSIKEVTR